MIVDTAVSGICHYTVAQNDFVVPGLYIAQIAVYAGGIELFHFSQVNIVVNPLV